MWKKERQRADSEKKVRKGEARNERELECRRVRSGYTKEKDMVAGGRRHESGEVVDVEGTSKYGSWVAN